MKNFYLKPIYAKLLKPTLAILSAFWLSVNLAHAQQNELRNSETYKCAMRLSRSSGSRSSLVAITSQEINLAYADDYSREEGMQEVFYFPSYEMRKDEESGREYRHHIYDNEIGGKGVFGRLLRSENHDSPILEISFYSKTKKDKGELRSGGLQHPQLEHWQLVPVFTVTSDSEDQLSDGSVRIHVDASRMESDKPNTILPSKISKFVGNNTYSHLDFECIKGEDL